MYIYIHIYKYTKGQTSSLQPNPIKWIKHKTSKQYKQDDETTLLELRSQFRYKRASACKYTICVCVCFRTQLNNNLLFSWRQRRLKTRCLYQLPSFFVNLIRSRNNSTSELSSVFDLIVLKHLSAEWKVDIFKSYIWIISAYLKY